MKEHNKSTVMEGTNRLFYGDNLHIMRVSIADESIDLCYCDPPFNSKRNYNQIYNSVEKLDVAQSKAFIDTWKWDNAAEQGYEEILKNERKRFPVQNVDLFMGLYKVLGVSDLMAYLIAMNLRIAEIYRILKPTGSFYLHCDPTASHYLKLVCDTIFCAQNGNFKNEVIWCYASGGVSKKYFAKKHDILLFYVKSEKYIFNTQYREYSEGTKQRGLTAYKKKLNPKYALSEKGAVMNDWWPDIKPLLSPTSVERLGYPTQKPEALLERIIKASSNKNDVVLDAYCGCGTTVSVAQRLKRQWIGIDITYQSISLILQRLDSAFGHTIHKSITLSGIPKDYDSAVALAHKKDDRTRKEFEKWAILTYSNNKAAINEKKGADGGIDGRAYGALQGIEQNAIYLFSVKSGKVDVKLIRDFRGVIEREKATAGVFITLQEPTAPMQKEAVQAGFYEIAGEKRPRIKIVTVQQILSGEIMDNLGTVYELHKKAQAANLEDGQKTLFDK